MHERACSFIPMPAPHEGVEIRQEYFQEHCSISYRGTAEDIVALGVLTQAEMDLPHMARQRRYDAHGRSFQRSNIPNCDRVQVSFWGMDRHLAGGLPGIRDPLAWVYRLLPVTPEQEAELRLEAVHEPLELLRR